MIAHDGNSYAKEGVSSEDDLVSLSERLPRLYSIADKHNRFRVEKLFNVYCSVVNDETNNGESLLKLATDNTHANDQGKECGLLYMSVGLDRYSLYVCDSCTNDKTCEQLSPNVVIFGIISDTFEEGSAAISHIRQVVCASMKPRQPILLFAYKTARARGRETDPKLLKELSALSQEINAYRCLDCSAVNRPTIRTVLAMALLAARPYISEFRSLSELKFDDDVPPVTNAVSMPDMAANQANHPPGKRKVLARLFSRKNHVSKMCSVQ